MSNIPIFQQRQDIQAPSSARFTQQASARSFGLQQAQNIQQAAQVGESLMKEYEDMVTRASVREKTNQARDRMRDFMSNDIYNLKGKDAVGAFDLTKKEIEKVRNELARDLKRGQETELFNRAFDVLAGSHLDRSSTFSAKAADQYRLDTLNATNETATQDAVAARNDLGAIQDHWEEIKRNTLDLNQGQSPEVKEAAVNAAQYTFYRRILDAKTADSPSAALDYFKDNKDKFKPSEVAQLENVLKQKAIPEKALIDARVIGSLPLDQQQKELDKIKDPERYRLTRGFVNQRNADKQAVAAVQKEVFKQEQYDSFLANPLGYDFNSSEFVQLDAADQIRMQTIRGKALTDFQAKTGAGPADKTDWAEYARLLDLAGKDELTTEKVLKSAKQLAYPELKELIKVSSKKGGEPERIITSYQLATQAVSGIRALNPKKGFSPQGHLKRRQYFEQFNKAIMNLPPEQRTPEKEGEIAEKLLQRVDSVFTKERYRFEMPYIDRENDSDKEEKLNLKFVPDNLKTYRKDLNYSPDDNEYWVRKDDVVLSYDITGRLVKVTRVPAGGAN